MAVYAECRVCGKPYKVCYSCESNKSGAYNWRRVACSPECGDIYLQQIIESRKPVEEKKAQVEPEPKTEEAPIKKQSTRKKTKKVVEADE